MSQQARRMRPWNQPGARPRITPRGTSPQPERRTTKSRTAIYGHRLMDAADHRRIRKYAFPTNPQPTTEEG